MRKKKIGFIGIVIAVALSAIMLTGCFGNHPVFSEARSAFSGYNITTTTSHPGPITAMRAHKLGQEFWLWRYPDVQGATARYEFAHGWAAAQTLPIYIYSYGLWVWYGTYDSVQIFNGIRPNLTLD